MKDFTEQELRDGRPDISVQDGVQFCLKALFADKKHDFQETVVRGLCFEELIGVLLLAEDAVNAIDEDAIIQT